MKATDKIIVNGKTYNLGVVYAATPEIPVVPDAPECTVTHDNGTEPASGTKWYVTPDGAGSMDGTSWNNAAAVSQIHVILLSAASGDSIYFAEGDYTADRTLTLPSGVSLFGGFPSENPTWATRDAFAHPTKWTASHSGAWVESTSNIAQIIDGFTIIDYNDTVSDAANVTFRNGFVSGGKFAFAGMVENSKIVVTALTLGSASGCWINGGTVTATDLTDCIVIVATSTVENALRTDFYFGDTSVTASADTVNVYGTEAAPVTVHLCEPTGCTVIYGKGGTKHYIFYSNGGTITNCTAMNCTVTNFSNSGYIFYSNGGTITNCTAMNCSISGSNGSSSNYMFLSFNGGTITNCTAVNCIGGGGSIEVGIFARKSTNCTAVNCSSKGYIFYSSSGNATNCTAVNCSSGNKTYYGKSTNCTAVNCTVSYEYIFYNESSSGITNCTAVNCSSKGYIFCGTAENCLSWNNDGTEFSSYNQLTSCAGSTYNAALALTLGTDNSIARFTNTGFAPAKGVQDVGDCPSPIDDPDGYAEWLSAFGDWHPAADSFLLGAGTADSSVTTDADGVTRPDPPAIGAYEAKPTQETTE